EADGFGDRARSHEKNRQDWQTVVAFYSSDGSLTKTGIQYLESSCIDRLRKAGWCDLENAVAPRLPTILPEDKASLEQFSKHVETLMRILGFNIYCRAPSVGVVGSSK